MDPLFVFKAIIILLIVGIVIAKVVSKPTRRARILGYMSNMQLSAVTGSGQVTAANQSNRGWSILVTIVGVGLVYWGFNNTQIRPADAGSWGWTNWLPLIIFWGVAATLIAINADGKTAATLQKVLAGVMLALLIVFPMVHVIWGEKTSSQKTQQQLAKPMLTMSPNSDSARISPDGGQIVIFTGNGFEHHLIYADGNNCVVGNTENPCKDGPILYQYVRDTTGKPNSVTYKFVR